MIYGCCRTNLDEAKRWTWPKVFAAVPRIGEKVKAKEIGPCTILKVVSVTHIEMRHPDDFMGGIEPTRMIGGIEVELNK